MLLVQRVSRAVGTPGRTSADVSGGDGGLDLGLRTCITVATVTTTFFDTRLDAGSFEE